jgi:hypothetical protein
MMSRVEVTHPLVECGALELDRRGSDGVDIVLAWEPRTNRVAVAVVDERTCDRFLIEVDPANALDAFYHPYAYVNNRVHRETGTVGVALSGA